jgi:tetratricopeptide (TPR) repeat protein
MPDVVALRFAEAVRCQQSGQLAEAVALYDRILRLKPNLAAVHNNRGVALADLRRFDEAETSYRRLIALDPKFPDAYNNLGNALCELGKPGDGELALRHAIELRPDWPRYQLNLGTALKLQGRLSEAEAAYRRAIALDPDFPDAYNNLGDLLWRLGRLDEAETVLRRAIALKPHFAEAFSNLGNVLKSHRRIAEAETAYRKAIELNPHFANAYNNLANTLLDFGRLDDAEQALRRAIALRPHLAEAHSNLGNTLRELGRLNEAEAACRRAVELRPDDAEAQSNLGNALMDLNRVAEAEAAYRRAIALRPDFASGYNNLGAALKYLGRLKDACEAVERAVRLAPHDASYFLNLGDLRRFDAGDPYLAAMENLLQSIESLPVRGQIELHFALAKAYEDAGRADDAFRHLLAGNALKRRHVAYNEAATLAELDRIRAIFTPELMQSLQGEGDPSPVPIFIVGMPRSGTTLIEQILASHPRVFGAGELPNLSEAVVDLTRAVGCMFPDAIAQMSAEDLRRLGARYVSEIAKLAPNAVHITNKMPSNFFFAGLIHLALPNARIIHAVRDPLDTCVSCFSKLFAFSQHQTYDLEELGRYYRRYQALMEHWHRLLPPGRILDVRYEDVVADLEGQARRIVSYCGLEWDRSCLAFHETARPVRTASATQVRRPLYRSAVGRAQFYAPFLRPLTKELSGSIAG